MMCKPKISVVITSYGRGELLKRAVTSVLDQTYSNIEVIVVDDHSDDDETKEVLKELSLLEKVTVLINDQNRGANYSRNRGILAASGEFYTGLDDDDYFLPLRCELMYKSYSDDYAFVCDNYIIDNGKRRKRRFLLPLIINVKDLTYSNRAGNQVFTSIEKIRYCGGFDENLKRLQDQDMWLRLACTFGRARRLNYSTYVMDTSHEGNRITNMVSTSMAYSEFYKKHRHIMTSINRVRSENRIKFYSKEKINPFCLLFSPTILVKKLCKI